MLCCPLRKTRKQIGDENQRKILQNLGNFFSEAVPLEDSELILHPFIYHSFLVQFQQSLNKYNANA